MLLNIKYFGMIAEATATNEEQIEMETCSVSQLLETLNHRYPELGHFDFKVAINQKLVTKEEMITAESEIALLPPFAGG